MPDKDVDEQFAAMMAHWDEEALGLDPFGDPDRLLDDPSDIADDPLRPEVTPASAVSAGSEEGQEVAGLDLDELERLADLDERHGLDNGRGSRHELDSLEQGFDFPVTPPPAPPRRPDLPPHQVPDFSGFVVDLGRTLGGPDPSGPAHEVDSAQSSPQDAPGTTSARGGIAGAGSGWRQHDVPEVEEHFVPPPPAPLPSADDKHFWLMVVGLVGGPLLFLYLLLFARDGHGWLMVFALSVTVAGFVLLVLRQPFERDEDDHGIRL